ncbi:MAG: hypothetical protein EOP06_27000 [Proteobacteria bacterium]|nr:MAG: hypothetical protein EOP06_27000 [Pseudomonadota bacterium]
MKQTQFAFNKDYCKEHGGTLRVGKRKTLRPLATKRPIHLVLKSHRNPATGKRCSLFAPGNYALEKIIRDQASKYHVKVHRISFVWSHIHMTMTFPSRAAYKSFIKSVTSFLIARLSKQHGVDLRGLFDVPPYTRVLSTRTEFLELMRYHDLNEQEALGLIRRQQKKPAQTRKGARKNASTS